MISIEQWRSAIGGSCLLLWTILSKRKVAFPEHNGQRWCLVLAVMLMIGCVEVNPGPGLYDLEDFMDEVREMKLFKVQKVENV